jgi:hypothetical protein
MPQQRGRHGGERQEPGQRLVVAKAAFHVRNHRISQGEGVAIDALHLQPRREDVIERHQPVLGTHTGPYGATSTVACTPWQRRQLTVRFPSLYITSSALPCRHAGVKSRGIVRATCTTGR